jgi:transposase
MADTDLGDISGNQVGKLAPVRLAIRQPESVVLVADLRVWFEAQLAKLPSRSATADAINHALNHWDGLARFLDDGRIDLETRPCGRTSAR